MEETSPDLQSIGSEVGSQGPIIPNPSEIIKLTKRRWAVLIAIASFIFLNSLAGETGSIMKTLTELLDLPLKKYLIIMQLFLNLPILTTVPAGWFIDKYGMKSAIRIATFLMLIIYFSRALLFNPDLPMWKQLKIVYWVVMHLVSSQAVTIVYCMPLKVSENWFSASERPLAWTIMMKAPDLGISINSFSLPRFIKKVDDVKPLFYLNLACAVVTVVVVWICITKSRPIHPPSERMVMSRSRHTPFIQSIKLTFKQKDLILHLLHEAVYLGAYISVYTSLQPILFSSGHSEIFVGNLMSITALLSVVMVISLSTLVHRMKNITLTCKLAALFRTTCLIPFLVMILIPTPEWAIIIVALLLSTFNAWSSPNLNNMTAHLSSGVIPEASIAAVANTTTIIFMNACMFTFVFLIEPKPDGQHDYTQSIIFASVVIVVDLLLYLIFFKGKSIEENSTTTTTRENPSLNATDCDSQS